MTSLQAAIKILFTYLLGHSKNDNMMPNIVVKSDVFVFNAGVQTTISKVYGQSYTPVFYGDTHVVIWVAWKMRRRKIKQIFKIKSMTASKIFSFFLKIY